MTDRPILFSAPMVHALLLGWKTQTRRVLKGIPSPPSHDNVVHLPPKHAAPYFDAYCGGKRTALNPRGMTDYWCWWTRDDRQSDGCKVRFVPGDRLWVKETWNIFAFSQDGEEAWPLAKIPTRQQFEEVKELAVRGDWQVVHRESDRARQFFADQKWRPSIHMPRWASRITLTVTDVRVHRLQDISEEDALAEGVNTWMQVELDGTERRRFKAHGREPGRDTAYEAFRDVWQAIHGTESWDANPWVAAISFDVHKGNIDG